MARNFTTGNRLSKAAAGATAYPFSFSVWVLMNSIAAGEKFIYSILQGTAPFLNYHTLFISTATPGFEAGIAGSGSEDSNTTANVTTTTWAHIAVVATSSVLRDCYLNGANKGTNTNSITPAGIDTTLIGAYQSAASTFSDGNGLIAFPALWNIALSAADVSSLATGVSPTKVRPQSLVSYCPLFGNSPDQDIVSSLAFTVTGTPTLAVNPRIYGR